MDFTEAFKQSQNATKFSPDSCYIATPVGNRLVVRDVDTMRIVTQREFPWSIQELLWSPDGEYLMVANLTACQIRVWSVVDLDWTAAIDETTPAGLLAVVKWAPDGRSIITIPDFALRLTIWSLLTKKVTYIQNPKYTDKGISFRADGKYLAIIERRDSKDYICIYSTTDWKQAKQISIDTLDCMGFEWSPDGQFIVVWENITEYKALIYSLDGRRVSNYSAYKEGLGIKCVSWSPDSKLLALGSYDQNVRILDNFKWSPINELFHTTNINIPGTVIYHEREKHEDVKILRNRNGYTISELPFTVISTRPDPEKPNPKLGVSFCEFNADGTLLASRNDNMPNTLWIWDPSDPRPLLLMHHRQPIKIVRWDPVHPGRIALCCGNGSLYLWTGVGFEPEEIEIPLVNFSIHNFRWSPDGRSLLLMDKETFCVAYFVNE
ncbi:uncharacterized protein VTP21DRAFT_359 [Calcarisporiella thermophila]|uniref:uncharacterized protein n=1 Tax=Calcarisporiella thermophila TaxID=911321 RepID=UPI00374462C4